jgi:hypothetical protein
MANPPTRVNGQTVWCSILVHPGSVGVRNGRFSGECRGSVASGWHIAGRYCNDGVRASLQLEVDLRTVASIAPTAFQVEWPRALPALTEPSIEDDFHPAICREPLTQVGIEIRMVARNDEERESHSPSCWTAWELLLLQPSCCPSARIRPQSLRTVNPFHKWYSTDDRAIVRVSDSHSVRWEPDDDESSVLELLVNVPRHPSVVRLPDRGSARNVGADTSIEDDLDPADAGETLSEILVEVCSTLRDHHEDPHAPQPTASRTDPRRNFSGSEVWHNTCCPGAPAEGTGCA